METTIRCPLEDCSRTFSLSGEEPFDNVYLELWQHAKSHEYENDETPHNREQGLEVILNHVGERLV